jgi:hypothetical protein
MRGLHMAKPDKEDFNNSRNFMQYADNLFSSKYSNSYTEDEWEYLDDEDEDKKIIVKLQKELCEEIGCSTKSLDNRILMYEFLKHKFENVQGCWWRALVAGELAIESFSDPTVDHLAFYPGFELFHVSKEQ